MSVDILWSVVFASVVVETIVNIVDNINVSRNPNEMSPGWKYWASLIVGLFVGVVVALNYNLDLFQLAGIEGEFPYVGAVLTGLIVSRGSNLANDLTGRLNAWKR